ncbi:MAG TPA: hypothetical protein VKR61_04610 [Bryobacteraceae bacterium]|nr:hypothetical protein [Bryobacteraceae bacterium]
MSRTSLAECPGVFPRTARPVRRVRQATKTTDFLLAAIVCSLIAAGFAVFSDRYHHWFLAPLLACGILIGGDGISWIRRREMVFNPATLLSVLGFHSFFIAPLLMVAWEYQLPYLSGQPDDWREWVGLMAILNAVGLCLYRWMRDLVRKSGGTGAGRSYRRLDYREFPIVAWIAILVCTALQIYIYIDFGGISGFVQRYLTDPEGWKNTGWMFAISESAPILAMITLATRLRKSPRKPGWPFLTAVLSFFFAVQLFFGALRGSRMNTVICLFWAAGIIHYWIRPIQRRLAIAGVACLLVFMYLAAFYKEAGFDMVSAFEGSVERDMLTARTHRTFSQVVVGDLARSDIQAFTVYRLLQPRRYDYAWGRSYLGALALLIPEPLWSDRPPGKVKWTTELEYGAGSYGYRMFHSSRVYGVSGEMMLNFGILAAPVGLLILGLIVGRIMRFLDRAHPEDCRLLLAPIFICLCFAVLILDSDNVLFFLVKYAAVPSAIVMFTSHNVSAAGARRA